MLPRSAPIACRFISTIRCSSALSCRWASDDVWEPIMESEVVGLETCPTEVLVVAVPFVLVLGAVGGTVEDVTDDHALGAPAHVPEEYGARALVAPDLEDVSRDAGVTLDCIDGVEEQRVRQREPASNAGPPLGDVLVAVHHPDGSARPY